MLFNETNLDKLYYNNPIKIDTNKIKVKVYVKNKDTFDKIVIKTPKSLIAYDPSKTKFNSLSLSLQPLTQELENFCSFFKKIDKCNKKHLKEIKSDIKYQSCIKKTNQSSKIMQFAMFKDCPVFSSSKKRKNINILKLDMEVSCFLELTHLWIKDGKAGTCWKVVQLKYYPPQMNYQKCLFLSDTDEESGEESYNSDSEEEVKPIKKPNIEIQKPPSIIKRESKGAISIQPKVFVPSVKDLLNIKNKLKKTSDS